MYEDDPSPQSAIVLVEKACVMLRRNLDSDSEERKLDCDEDCLYRSFVEVMELRKEKSVACLSEILPRVCLGPLFLCLVYLLATYAFFLKP